MSPTLSEMKLAFERDSMPPDMPISPYEKLLVLGEARSSYGGSSEKSSGTPKVVSRFYDETPVDEATEKVIDEIYRFSMQKEDDAVNPKHYKSAGGIEAIQAMEAFSTLEEFRGHMKLTALKYISRLGLKDDESQEIGKAMWYLEKLKTTYAEEYTHGGR